MDRYLRANRRRWDALAPIHRDSVFYDVEGFKAGGMTLRSIEREELGEVKGKSLLHLQCHFGLDTLSWARLGAKVAGVDFSGKAISLARELAEESGLEGTFIQADIYELPEVLKKEFDVVFTSYGVLCWLPDIPRWAKIVAGYVGPGGVFYIVEDHPFAQMFANETDTQDLDIEYPYFPSDEPTRFEAQGSYAEAGADVVGPSYEWFHSLGEVVTSLIDAGLRIEFLHEFPYSCWARFPFMEQGEDGWWRLRDSRQAIPLTFSLLAKKEPRSG